MDIDAFVAAHRASWDRLEQLVRRRRELTGVEVDELVELYQRVATHLSIVRSSTTDALLIGRLSALVARARSAVSGAHAPAWREFTRFFTSSFPAMAYSVGRWWLGATAGFMIVAVAVAWWIVGNPEVQSTIATPEEIKQLVEHDFADYYSEHPALSFAGKVWVNNAFLAIQTVMYALLLGIPIPWVLLQNALNVGVSGGLMIDRGHGDVFFGLITPHGLLELTAIFLAAGAGMRLGWTVIDPGGKSRGQALAEQGRAMMNIALGMIPVLLISGLIEGLVTPSGLPTWARVGIGVLAEAAFLAYVVILGRRALREGETGDIEQAPDMAPATG
ncbi:stage II sporulation protein M [Bailinhaonella thermotolerans]|uniref:Stage II sporulation protein M n=1 Tax=Bailinhaonella thermotolerans TaxID=1070861 RepID=A0A3A4B8L7_9ACTN|nr:stage II sporulation protein M [Bailinhaonella thermotolerans]RJL30468.1 stage II sporulation protein M [Bailinhaonella thermotolerans]